MAGVSWAEGASNETDASSGPRLGAEFQHSLLAATYSVVFVLGLVGNALSLYLLSCRVKHFSHSHIYMIHLALLDTLFLGTLPLHIHSLVRGGGWAFGAAACGAAGAVSGLHLALGVAFLGCVCVDAQVAVLHPLASVRLRAAHHGLLAAALWGLALGLTVPLALRGPPRAGGARDGTSCLEPFPAGARAPPAAPRGVPALVLGFVVPVSVILLGFPLLAASVSRSRRRGPKRKALGTIYIVLGICALCFLPYHLTQLLRFLLGAGVIREEPFPSLIPGIQRVALALVSCSCCLKPVLYLFHSSSRHWRCPLRLRLRFRSKRVFTICDQDFGVPSYNCKLRQSLGRKSHGVGISWSRSDPRGF